MRNVLVGVLVSLSLFELDCKDPRSALKEAIKKLRALLDKWLAKNIPDDTYLDQLEWQQQYADEWLKSKKNQGQYSPDCSYVDDTLSKDLSVGYLDIVISPVLVLRPETRLGQHIRLIFHVVHSSNDLIRLYEKSPDHNGSAKIVWESQVNPSSMYYVDTDVFYEKGSKYSAEYIRDSERVLLSTKYYHERASWMWCMRDKIRARPLNKIFLPGTHDSGAYTTPQWWQNHFYVTKIYYSYVFTQEDSIFSQLLQGARTLDLRIGKYVNSTSRFYVNHNDFRIHPLKDVLVQIIAFLGVNPYEIIVLDFHGFPNGFDHVNDHEELAEVLKTELGGLLYQHPTGYTTWQVTLDDVWQTNGRIFVAYNNHETAIRNGFYLGVHQIWGNKDELSHLDYYMDLMLTEKYFEESETQMYCAMVELTPKPLGIVTNKYNGLRKLASETNSLVTLNFVMGSWGDTVQAAAVDFIASTGIVTAAILQNSLRAQEPSYSDHKIF